MAQKNIDIQFPLGGLNRAVGFQKQPPYTTADCQNIVLYDNVTGRARGSTRPGFGLSSDPTNTPTGYPVNMLDSVTYMLSDGFKEDIDDFESDTLGGGWQQTGSGPTLIAFPTITGGQVVSTGTGTVLAAKVVESALDTTKQYSVETFVLPYNGTHSCTYLIGGMFDNVLPDSSNNGFGFALTLNGLVVTYTLAKVASGIPTIVAAGTATAMTYAAPGWITVLVSGTTVTCKWRGATICSGTIAGLTGTRIGFGMKGLTATSTGVIDSFRTRYYSTSLETRQVCTLISASNGKLYRKNDFGYMEEVSSNLTLASDRYLSCAERTQKVYIADNGEIKKAGTDGAISAGAVLTATGVTDWTTYGINKYTDVVMLSSTTGSTAGQYTITTVAAGGLTLSPAPGAGTGSYSVSRGAKVYDPIANTLSLWTATSGKGSVPVNCTMVCRYRDRVVLSGAADFPQLWYMSRQGDPLDWDYNPTVTTGAAVAGSNSESGALGEPITAIIPYGDDYLLFGCPNSLWILRGDPTYGGSIDNISKTVGIVGRKAWCIGPSGEFIFCSRNGIYAMSSPTALQAQMISRAVLPKELLNINTNDNDVFLAYDIKLQAVHIIRTPSNSSVKYNYMLDWNTKTFWPTTSAKLTTSSICEFYSPDAESTAVLFGGRDGGIRRYDTRFLTDDGTNISAYIFIGPLALGNGINLGIFTDLIAELGLDGGNVLCEIYVGDSPEQALRNTAVYSGTLADGVSYHLHPRCRGMTAFIKLSNVSGSAWSYERMIGIITAGGMQRL